MEAMMELNAYEARTPRANAGRALVVADWSLDPEDIVDAMGAHSARHGTHFALLVPATLHGLAWAGDPNASRPCAERRLGELTALTERAGIPVEMARVGDPETVPAVKDLLEDWPAEEILLFGRRSRRGFPRALSLARRVKRSTALPVYAGSGRRRSTSFRAGRPSKMALASGR
jgi:hypothetical protein